MVQDQHHPVDLFFANDERRRHREHIAPQRPDYDALLEGRQPDPPSSAAGGLEELLGGPVTHELDTGDQAEAAHVAYDLVRPQVLEPLQEVSALFGRSFHEVLVLEDLQVPQCDGASSRVAAVCEAMLEWPFGGFQGVMDRTS